MPEATHRHARWTAAAVAATALIQAWLWTMATTQVSPAAWIPPEAGRAVAAVAVAAAAWVLFLPPRGRWPALAAIAALGSAAVLADLLYFRHFEAILPAAAALHGGQAGQVRDSLQALLRPADAVFAANLAVLAALRRLAGPAPGAGPAAGRPPARLALAGLLAACAAVVGATIAGFDRQNPNALAGGWNPRYAAACIGLPAYHAVDAYQTFTEARVPAPSRAWVRESAAALAQARPVLPGPWTGVAAGRSLIVVQAEALQGFVIGLRVGGVEITPTLNRLAREGHYFPNVYAQVRAGNTSDAEFMAQTSLYPALRGAAFVRYAGHRYHALPARLREAGYATAAFHGNAPGFWNRYAMYPALGFERFYSAADFRMDDVLGLGLSDRSFFAQGIARLRALPRPFYAWMVTLSSHHPYVEAARRVDLGLPADQPLGAYLASMRYLDDQLATFLRDLDAAGLGREAVVAIAGDHPGVARDEEPALRAVLGPGAGAWRDLQKVPFIVRLPGKPGGVHPAAAGQVDLMPTLAGVMGVRPGPVFGRDLLRPQADFVVLPDGGVVQSGQPDAPARARWHLETSAAILAHDLVGELEEEDTSAAAVAGL